jgi:hypothetical protein
MRLYSAGLIGLLALWGSLLAGNSQELSVTEFVTAPPRAVAAAESEWSGREWVQDSAGIHQGHRIFTATADLATDGQPTYTLSYNACLETARHPDAVDLIAKEGGCGLGLSGPTGANWYGGGAIDVRVNDLSLAPYRPRLVRAVAADGRVDVIATYPTPLAPPSEGGDRGGVTLTFSQQPGEDHLLVRGHVEAKGPVTSLEVRLICYPATFAEPRRRGVATALRRVEGPQRLLLRRREPWAVL